MHIAALGSTYHGQPAVLDSRGFGANAIRAYKCSGQNREGVPACRLAILPLLSTPALTRAKGSIFPLLASSAWHAEHGPSKNWGVNWDDYGQFSIRIVQDLARLFLREETRISQPLGDAHIDAQMAPENVSGAR